jgi:hypothetical protein
MNESTGALRTALDEYCLSFPGPVLYYMAPYAPLRRRQFREYGRSIAAHA